MLEPDAARGGLQPDAIKALFLKERFFKMLAVVIAERIPNYYFWNVYVPTLLIVCMVSGAFVIDPTDVNDRYSVTLTLTLVSVTYK